MRYAADHKGQTRRRILNAAAKRFREDGLVRTPVGSIMRDADLTHGGFYAHFESKDDLIAEVIRDGFDSVSDRFEARFADLPDQAWLQAWVEAYLSEDHQQNPGVGCPLPCLAAEVARSGPAARRAWTDAFNQRLRSICQHVPAPPKEAERRVLAAISQMAGALMLSRALVGRQAKRIRAAAAEQALAILLATTPNPTHKRDGE